MTKDYKRFVGKVVLVVWVDSSFVNKWATSDEIDPELVKVSSIGYMIDETNSAIIMAGHKTDVEEPQYSGIMVIPKCSVTQIKVVKV